MRSTRKRNYRKSLVSQNDVFQGLKHFKLRKFLSNPRREYAQYSAIVELDAATFFKVMELEKLNVGWDRCRVFDGVDVLRCFKCCGFNHKGADCKVESEICPICSENHRVKECKATQEKCINCVLCMPSSCGLMVTGFALRAEGRGFKPTWLGTSFPLYSSHV